MLTPIFDFSSNSVLLYSGLVSVKRNKKKYDAIGKIKLNFLPKAKVVINTEFGDPHLSGVLRDNKVEFFINQQLIDVFAISEAPQFLASPFVLKIDWVAKSNSIQIILDRRKKAKKIIFHIFNFMNFRGVDSFTQLYNGTMYRLAYIDLKWKTFNIKIQSLPSTSDNIQYLKENSGYKITQVGSIEKQNGLISNEEQENLELALRYFLSFAKGSWISPTCLVGIAKTEEDIWYSFNSPNTDWKSLKSWFDPLHTSSLVEFFPLFMNLWDSERWKDTFKEVIYWFLNANDGARGVDTGLILTQTALERLSFEYVVYEKKLLSTKGFKDIWASDKFRILFSSLNLPLDIPSSLSALSKKAKEYNWLDAPHALTEIRNSLVHPEHKKHGKFETDIFIEAHTLSLWYLEMSILAICKFNGVYSNRLVSNKFVGTVENVPWIHS